MGAEIIGGQPTGGGQPAPPAAPPAAAPAAPASDGGQPPAAQPPAAETPKSQPADLSFMNNNQPQPPTTPPPAQPQQPSLYDQIQKANLQDILPEEYKNDPHLTRVKDIPTLLKNYSESQKFVSQSVRLPGEEATEQEKADFYKKLGRPESADDYQFNIKQEFVEKGAKLDEAQNKWFRDMAIKANLTQDQVNVLFDEYTSKQMGDIEGTTKDMQKTAADTIAELQRTWRSDYQNNINLINSRLDNFFPKELQEKFKAKGLFSDKDFILAVHGLTKNITGDNLYVEGGNVAGIELELDKLEKARRDLMVAPDRRSRKNEEFELNKTIAELKSKLNR